MLLLMILSFLFLYHFLCICLNLFGSPIREGTHRYVRHRNIISGSFYSVIWKRVDENWGKLLLLFSCQNRNRIVTICYALPMCQLFRKVLNFMKHNKTFKTNKEMDKTWEKRFFKPFFYSNAAGPNFINWINFMEKKTNRNRTNKLYVCTRY